MGWELITPNSLAELDSGQNTKLSGVEANATAGAAWGSNLTGRPSELTDGRVSAGLASNGDVARTVAVGKGGTGHGTDTGAFYNGSMSISTSGNAITLGRGSYSGTSITGLSQSLVALSGVVNNADVTGSNTAYDTARVNGTTASTVRTGAAAGATANQDSTSTIRNGVTKSMVGLGNVDNNSTATIRAGTTKANVGLGNVDNNSTATIRGGITISSNGALNGAGGGQVTASGLGANTDSTATIRNGIVTAETNKAPSIFWSNLKNNMTPSFSTYDVTVVFRNGSGTVLQTTEIRVSRTTTALNAATVNSGSSTGVTLGTATSSGSTQTTTVQYGSTVVKITGFIINGSTWTFK